MSDLPPPTPPPAPPTPVAAPTPPEVPVSPPEVPAAAPLAEGEPPQPRNQDEKTLGILLHALPALGVFIGSSTFLPSLAAILPLAFWFWKRDSSPYLKAHGKEVVQFAATYTVPAQVLTIIPFVGCLAYPLVLAACLLTAILSIVGAVKTSSGETYRYPYTVRFLE